MSWCAPQKSNGNGIAAISHEWVSSRFFRVESMMVMKEGDRSEGTLTLKTSWPDYSGGQMEEGSVD